MKEVTLSEKRYERLTNSLLSTIEQFRNGNDHLGLDYFLNSIVDLEILLALNSFMGEEKQLLDMIIPVMEKVYLCLQNKDVVGLTDILEYKLFALTQQWFKGCEQN